MRVSVSPIVNDVHHAVASAALRSRNTVPSCRDRPCRCRCWTGNVVHPTRRRFRLGWIVGWIFHMACTISHGIGKMGSDPCDVTGICAMSRPHAAWVHSAARSSSGTSAGRVRSSACVNLILYLCDPTDSRNPMGGVGASVRGPAAAHCGCDWSTTWSWSGSGHGAWFWLAEA